MDALRGSSPRPQFSMWWLKRPLTPSRRSLLPHKLVALQTDGYKCHTEQRPAVTTKNSTSSRQLPEPRGEPDQVLV